MNYQVVLQTEAVVDIQAAFDWYEQQRNGLGYELLEEVEDKYRKLRIKRFPYLVVFEIEDIRVIVIAVRRISQEPIR